MRVHKGTSLLFMLVAALLLMSACGTGSSATAGSVLQNSLNAMKQLKTVHVNMTMSDSIQMSGLPTPTASTSGQSLSNLTVSIKGGGDEVFPDQSSLQLTLNLGGLGSNLKLSEVTKAKKLYVQNTKGQWYVMDQDSLKGSTSSSLFSSVNTAQYNQLLSLAQKAKFTDHGDETLNGQSLRHITVTFGKDVLKDLLNAIGQSTATGVSSQELDNVLKGIAIHQATLDLWVDEGTSVVHRLDFKLAMTINPGSLITPTTASTKSGSITTTIDTAIDYSKFNDSSIKVNAPANAIPTTDPLAAFGM